jgi:serine-type D-Ala-D-Ala endopeptidase (penicillin-binding protein 7)
MKSWRSILGALWLSAAFVAAGTQPTLAQAAGKQGQVKSTKAHAKAKAAPVARVKATNVRADKKDATNGGARAAAKRGKSVAAARGLPTRHAARQLPRLAQRRIVEPPVLSYGQQAGLHAVEDELQLKSAVALVVDQDTDEVLLRKNEAVVLPIASLTKLMTGLVLSESGLPMERDITISDEDVDNFKGSRSRLAVGTTLPRGEMLHLALMSSENRAAHALGRTFPGGLRSFVLAMNAKAQALGMRDTRFVEPTGLSSSNQSSARDLATLVKVASQHQLLRELSTSMGSAVAVGERVVEYRNTNGLVLNPNWQIGLQKTGYIREAGRCLVMQATVGGRRLIMVFLDSAGKYSRMGDAERVRQWLETGLSAMPSDPAPKKSPQL